MEIKDWVNGTIFVFTIIIVVYGMTKGFNTIELVLHVVYFTALILSQVLNLMEVEV